LSEQFNGHLPLKRFSETLLLLVTNEARRIKKNLPSGVISEDDLYAEGIIGLMEAQRRFDPRKGVNLEAYARWRIRGSMLDALRRTMPLSRRGYESVRRQALSWHLQEPKAASTQTDGIWLRNTISQLTTLCLLDSALNPKEEPSPEKQLLEKETLARLRRVIESLSSSDQEVIRAVYDMKEQGESGASLARRQGISRSTISRKHSRLLRRIRRLMEEPTE